MLDQNFDWGAANNNGNLNEVVTNHGGPNYQQFLTLKEHYWYDIFGTLVAEYSSQPSATPPPCSTCYISSDHLGNTRLVTDANHVVVARHDYTPFGEEIPGGYAGRGTEWGGYDAVNQKFTGKERDGETGLDYFGARYFNGLQGRWTSPDVVNLTDARMEMPSSTLNKFVYGGNNPLKFVDPDGEDITVYYTDGGLAGHTMMMAYNQATGDSAVQSFGPVSHSAASETAMGLGIGVSGTANYGFGDIKSADQLRQEYASITIQTSPEETQKVIQYIRTHSDGDYKTYSNNCTTTCAKILRNLSLYKNNAITPKGFFTDLLHQYGSNKNIANIQDGVDYGKPRPGYNAFSLLWLSIQKQQARPKKKEVVTTAFCYTDETGKQHCSSSN